MIDPKTVRLVRGKSPTPVEGACVEQLVTLLAGEPWSDQPECACPVIAAFALGTNDWMTEEERPALYECAVRQIGTRNDGRTQWRMFRCADWAVREILPLALDASGLPAEAENLRSLPPIVDAESAAAGVESAVAAADSASGLIGLSVASAAAAAAAAAVAAVEATRNAAAAAAAAAAVAATETAWIGGLVRAVLVRLRLALLDELCPPWPSVAECERLNWEAVREVVCCSEERREG